MNKLILMISILVMQINAFSVNLNSDQPLFLDSTHDSIRLEIQKSYVYALVSQMILDFHIQDKDIDLKDLLQKSPLYRLTSNPFVECGKVEVLCHLRAYFEISNYVIKNVYKEPKNQELKVKIQNFMRQKDISFLPDFAYNFNRGHEALFLDAKDIPTRWKIQESYVDALVSQIILYFYSLNTNKEDNNFIGLRILLNFPFYSRTSETLIEYDRAEVLCHFNAYLKIINYLLNHFHTHSNISELKIKIEEFISKIKANIRNNEKEFPGFTTDAQDILIEFKAWMPEYFSHIK